MYDIDYQSVFKLKTIVLCENSVKYLEGLFCAERSKRNIERMVADYGHTGGIDGFRSVYSHFDDEKISYALTSSGTNINNNDFSIAVFSASHATKPRTVRF